MTLPPPVDKSKEMFLRVISTMLRPYLKESIEELRKYDKAFNKEFENMTEQVEGKLLEKFWHLSQTDSQISLAMIPIMAYIKRADRKIPK